MKTWVHAPVWVADRKLGNSGMRIAYHILYLSFFDNEKNSHSEIAYKPSDWAKELGMGKATVINSIKKMVELGYILRTGSKIRPLEKGIEIEPGYSNRTPKVLKQNSKGIEVEPEGIEVEPVTPVYDRLGQGFPTLLVLLKYFYSKTTVVGVADFIMILKNCHKMEVFIMARKENFTDPGDKMLGFKNNNKFQGCIKWLMEAYEEDDNSGDDLPMDRYLLYLLLDCIRNGKKPEGRFISAITKLQNDGERFPIDLTEAKLIDEKDAAAIEMARREKATLRMVDDLDKPIESTRVGDINLLEMFKNKKREVN